MDVTWDSKAKLRSLRVKRRTETRHLVQQWIHDYTTPSSNTRNVVMRKHKGTIEEHVVHWRTETLAFMYDKCKKYIFQKTGRVFFKSFFISCMPFYIRLKRRQDGLCPAHYTGIALAKELGRKRSVWHKNCTCTCDFCKSTGCNHGHSPLGGKYVNFKKFIFIYQILFLFIIFFRCSFFTCNRCARVKCPAEWNSVSTRWLRPVQKKRQGGGIYWTNEEMVEHRSTMLTTLKKEMSSFAKHSEHVQYSKEQMQNLQDQFGQTEVIIKADFIQNIVHHRGQETSQSYYGKRQTQFLCFVVWFHVIINGTLTKKKLFFDYLSSYLKHNSLYFQKCLTHLLLHLQVNLGIEFSKVC